jgi:hypothetical protein
MLPTQKEAWGKSVSPDGNIQGLIFRRVSPSQVRPQNSVEGKGSVL